MERGGAWVCGDSATARPDPSAGCGKITMHVARTACQVNRESVQDPQARLDHKAAEPEGAWHEALRTPNFDPTDKDAVRQIAALETRDNAGAV